MNAFEHRAQKYIDLARQQDLMVLIWGPGDPGENGAPEAKRNYDKRCDIRAELRNIFPRSRVEFSEDLRTDSVIGVLPQEALHAASSDLVIVLEMSRGAHLELDHFTKYSWFRSKVWLLAPQEYLDTGIAAEVSKLIPKDQRQGFTDEEFKRCDVAKRMSVDIVTTVALIKLLEL